MKKKHIAQIILIFILIFILASFFVCCQNEYNNKEKSTNEGNSIKVYSESQAISLVKNRYGLNEQIARTLGFKTYAPPEYGICSANKDTDGSWNVSLKGNMGGFIDDYRMDLEYYKFEVTASVLETGFVIFSVEKID